MPYKDPQRRKEYKKEYYQKNRKKILKQAREYNARTREIHSKKGKEYYRKNKEKVKERVRKYNNEHKKECLKRANEWRKNNPEKRKAALRRYYEKKLKEDPEYFSRKAKYFYHKDIEKSRKNLRDYRKKNPNLVRLWKYNRRAKCKFSSIDKEHITKDFEQKINEKMKKQNYKCIYCRADLKDNYSLDHILPLSRGGTNDIDNIDVVCKSCNTSKGRRTKEEYLKILHKDD